MEIRGRFVDGRPQLDGRLSFPDLRLSVRGITFIVDTGADRSVWIPSAKDVAAGIDHRSFSGYPVADTIGFGGSFAARKVPAELLMLSTDGLEVRRSLEIEVARRSAETAGLPSVLGRDVLDLFRLTVDRATALVVLSDAGRPYRRIR